MASSITRADPLQLPTEILQQIFQDDIAMLTTCMLLNKAWYARMKPLCQTFTKITVNLMYGVNTAEEHWKNGIINFMNPTLTSVNVKAEQAALWQLLELLDENHEQARITCLEMSTPKSFEWQCVPSNELATSSTMYESLSSISIEAVKISNMRDLLLMCTGLTILNRRVSDLDYIFEDRERCHNSLRTLQISHESELIRWPMGNLPYLPKLQVLRIINNSQYPAYHINSLLPYVCVRMPNIKTFYVGGSRMTSSTLADMPHSIDGPDSTGIQELDLEKNVCFWEQEFPSFFETASRTLTRLRFGKLHHIRTLRPIWEGRLLSLRELELESSLNSKHDYITDIGWFLSCVPNLSKLSMVCFISNTVSALTQPISQLRRLDELCIRCRPFLGDIDISYFGHLPCIQKIELLGAELTHFDRFLDNLVESGGLATLTSLRLDYIIEPFQAEGPMDVLLETCTGLKFAELSVMNASDMSVDVFSLQQ